MARRSRKREPGAGIDELVCDALASYDARVEHPWRLHPEYEALVHADNGRMFALVANVSASSLGKGGGTPGAGTRGHARIEGERVDIVTVKVGDPMLASSLMQQKGYYPGFPLHRGGWVTISLMGDVAYEEIRSWLAESYLLTASKAERERMRPPKEWLIPSNPKYYDIVGAFEAADEIDWKQGRGIRIDDTVFMYVGAPYSAILYKCVVTATDIPFVFDEGDVHMRSLMRIRLLERYDQSEFPLAVLARDYGVTTVRGPRGVPSSLSEALAFAHGA